MSTQARLKNTRKPTLSPMLWRIFSAITSTVCYLPSREIQTISTTICCLYAKTLSEAFCFSNKYYAPSANPCVGYASNDVNATTNIMRGSMNLTETKKLDNGYRFVWDFTTSQANGTISCIALTHKWAGIGYMGDGYNGTSSIWVMRSRNANSSGEARTAYINAVEINPEENYFWTIGINTSNELIIQKIRMSFTAVGLNDTMLGSNYDVLLEIKLNPTMFVMSNPSSNEGAYDFFDGKDGYWYGFWGGNNKSASRTFHSQKKE